MLKRLDPYIQENPKGKWEDWVRQHNFGLLSFNKEALLIKIHWCQKFSQTHEYRTLKYWTLNVQVAAAYVDRVSLSATGFYKYVKYKFA